MFLQALLHFFKSKFALPDKEEEIPSFQKEKDVKLADKKSPNKKSRANMIFSSELQKKKKSPFPKPSIRYSARTRELFSIEPEPASYPIHKIHRDDSSSDVSSSF